MKHQRRVVPLFGCAVIVLAICGQLRAQTNTPTQASMHFKGGRAIADAVEVLRHEHGWAISYEDPTWASSLDVKDITERVTKHPENGRRILSPIGPAFDFQYAVQGGKSKEGPLTLLKRMLSEYALQGGVVFRAEEREGRFGKRWIVEPVSFRNGTGEFKE